MPRDLIVGTAYESPFRFILVSNNPPAMPVRDDALNRRLYMFSFNAKWN